MGFDRDSSNWDAKIVFVASGRRVPRTGGVILALGASRDEFERILATDPLDAVRTYDVTEFAPSMTSPDLASVAESATGKW